MTTFFMLGLLAVGLWLLFGGNAGRGNRKRSRRSGRGGPGALTLIVLGLLIGATATGAAVIHTAVSLVSSVVSTVSGLLR